MTWLNDAEVKTVEQQVQEKEIADKRKREIELQKLLDSTDHKVLPDYDKKEGEDLDAIKTSRYEWRSEIREIQKWLKDNEPEPGLE